MNQPSALFIKSLNKFWQPVSLVDGSGNVIDLGQAIINNYVDSTNSTFTNLLANEIYLGTSNQCLNAAIIFVSIYTDQDSANDGLQFLTSSNGTDWYVSDSYTILKDSDKTFSFQPNRKYFKIKYTNGAVNQTVFDLQTIVKGVNSKPSAHRISDNIIDDDDAELVKAVLTGKDNLDVFRNIGASQRGSLNVSLKEYQGDAFGRLRVSEPYTLFDNSLVSTLSDTLFWSTLIAGTAAGVYSQLYSRYTLSVTSNNDYIVRQTKTRFKYQPGKSHLVLITGLFYVTANVLCEVGYADYDNIGLVTITDAIQNGIVFRNNGGILSFAIYNNGIKTEEVIQTNWNIDKCNGAGESSFLLDIASTNILFFDMEWLGVGAVRCGFVNTTGEIIIAHQFKHASNGFVDVYMRTANLPVSYKLKSLGGAGSIKQLCSSVVSEGGFNPQGITSALTTAAGIAISANDTELLCGIKLKEDSFGFTIDPTNVSISNVSISNSMWWLCVNPVYAGVVTWVDLPNTELQYALNNNNLVSNLGIIIASGVISNENSNINESIQSAYKIGKDLAGNIDALWIVVKSLSNDTYYGTINFRQYV